MSTSEFPIGDTLSTEARLLFSTAAGKEADPSIRQLLPLVTWPRLLTLAASEGAYPVFARRILACGGSQLPPVVSSGLREQLRFTELRQSYLHCRLMELLGAFADAGIPVVLLKGAAMATSTHGSFSERPMSDLDLLIDPAGLAEAITIASANGWSRRFAEQFDSLYDGMHHLPPLIDVRAPAMSVKLELHRELVPPQSNPFAFSASLVRLGAEAAPGLPGTAGVPRIDHRLIHCCIHFAWSHQMRSGSWKAFRDVDAVVRDRSFEWPRFLIEARRSRASACCYWTMRLARALVHAPIPDEVLDQLRPAFPRPLQLALERHLSGSLLEPERICPSERLAHAAWKLAAAPDRDDHGTRPSWRSGHQAWHLLSDGAGEGRRGVAQRAALSPHAWTRYLARLLGTG